MMMEIKLTRLVLLVGEDLMFDESTLSSFHQIGQVLLEQAKLRGVLGVLLGHAPDHEALGSQDPERLGDVIGRHGTNGESSRGDHHIIALLSETCGPDTTDLSPDVVPVQVGPLQSAQGRHVLVQNIHLEESSGLDTCRDIARLRAEIQNLQQFIFFSFNMLFNDFMTHLRVDRKIKSQEVLHNFVISDQFSLRNFEFDFLK